MKDYPELTETKPKRPGLSLLSKGLAGADSFLSQNKLGALLSSGLGVPDAAKLLEKLAYGDRLTTGSGQTLKPAESVVEGGMALAPVLGSGLTGLGKLAGKIPTQLDSAPNAIGWHGTTAKAFDEFKPNIRKNEQLGFGIHFADERPFAELYAIDPTIVRKKAGEPLLYKADLTYQNPLNSGLVQEGSPEFELAKKLAGKRLFSQKDEEGIPTAFLQNAIDATSPERAARLIQDAGFDAVRYNSRVGELNPGASGLSNVRRSPSTVVFSPQQIKILERIVLEKGFARGR